MANALDGAWFDEKSEKKECSFLPDLTVFEDLSIGSDMLEELLRFIKVIFSLRLGKKRICDPEGHINNIKRTLITKREITHEFDLEEDVIRNLVHFADVFERRKRWLMMMRWEDQERGKDKKFKGFFDKEPDLFKRMQLVLGKFDELSKKAQEEKSAPLPTPQPPTSTTSTSHTPPSSPIYPSPPSQTNEPPAKKLNIGSLVDYESSDEEKEVVLTLAEMKEVADK